MIKSTLIIGELIGFKWDLESNVAALNNEIEKYGNDIHELRMKLDYKEREILKRQQDRDELLATIDEINSLINEEA